MATNAMHYAHGAHQKEVILQQGLACRNVRVVEFEVRPGTTTSRKQTRDFFHVFAPVILPFVMKLGSGLQQ